MGDDDRHTLQDDEADNSPFVIRRSVHEPFSCAAIGSLFPLLWLLERFHGVGAEFILIPGFTAFVFLFVTPFTLLMLHRIVNDEPVLLAENGRVNVSNVTLPWLRAELLVDEIITIESDWIEDTSHARIAFRVTPECYARQPRFGAWNAKRNGTLYFDILNTDCTPDAAARTLRLMLRMAVQRI